MKQSSGRRTNHRNFRLLRPSALRLDRRNLRPGLGSSALFLPSSLSKKTAPPSSLCTLSFREFAQQLFPPHFSSYCRIPEVQREAQFRSRGNNWAIASWSALGRQTNDQMNGRASVSLSLSLVLFSGPTTLLDLLKFGTALPAVRPGMACGFGFRRFTSARSAFHCDSDRSADPLIGAIVFGRGDSPLNPLRCYEPFP